jgi:membrane protease YdiL (CAAX protease family)
MRRRLFELDAVMVFVVVNLALIVVSAVLCGSVMAEIEPGAGAMLRASLTYVAVVGWQPLAAFAVARRLFAERNFDDGIRPLGFRDTVVPIVIAMFVVLVAVVIDVVANRAGGNAEAAPRMMPSYSLIMTVKVLVAFAAVVAILWLQAIIEEVAWRGYVLPRLMRTFGPWPGLAVHGFLWGLCYSPFFAVAGGSVGRTLVFVVTSGLLGIVLGWLRLSSRSIYASAASNATLTICAGLPLVVLGKGSLLSAAFGPLGWVPLAAIIVAIACYRPWRRAIAIPWRRTPEHVN